MEADDRRRRCIVTPTRRPPHPSASGLSTLSTEAKRVWEELLNKHQTREAVRKRRLQECAPVDPATYYSGIYRRAFGKPLTATQATGDEQSHLLSQNQSVSTSQVDPLFRRPESTARRLVLDESGQPLRQFDATEQRPSSEHIGVKRPAPSYINTLFTDHQALPKRHHPTFLHTQSVQQFSQQGTINLDAHVGSEELFDSSQPLFSQTEASAAEDGGDEDTGTHSRWCTQGDSPPLDLSSQESDRGTLPELQVSFQGDKTEQILRKRDEYGVKSGGVDLRERKDEDVLLDVGFQDEEKATRKVQEIFTDNHIEMSNWIPERVEDHASQSIMETTTETLDELTGNSGKNSFVAVEAGVKEDAHCVIESSDVTSSFFDKGVEDTKKKPPEIIIPSSSTGLCRMTQRLQYFNTRFKSPKNPASKPHQPQAVSINHPGRQFNVPYKCQGDTEGAAIGSSHPEVDRQTTPNLPTAPPRLPNSAVGSDCDRHISLLSTSGAGRGYSNDRYTDSGERRGYINGKITEGGAERRSADDGEADCGKMRGYVNDKETECGEGRGCDNDTVGECGAGRGSGNGTVAECGAGRGSSNGTAAECGAGQGSGNGTAAECGAGRGSGNGTAAECGAGRGWPVDALAADPGGRATIKAGLEAAAELALTLVYEDGTSQLREAAKSQKKKKDDTKDDKGVAMVISYPPAPLCFVRVPLVYAADRNGYDWCREVVEMVMTSSGRKLCFDAQELIRRLVDVFDFPHSAVVTRWRVLDPRVAGWLLSPDGAVVTFSDLLQTHCDKLQLPPPPPDSPGPPSPCPDLALLGPAMLQLYHRLHERHLWSIYTRLETPLCPMLAVMELRPLGVHMEELLRGAGLLKRELQRLERAAHKAAGHSFLIHSHPQLRQVLFEELQLDVRAAGVKRIALTNVRQHKSTSEAVLLQLNDVHELPGIVLNYRQVAKLKSTYYDGILECMQGGAVYPHWDHTAAATGRLTACRPNIQAVPRKPTALHHTTGDDDPVVEVNPRSHFIAKDGFTFLAIDFRQVELRVVAHLSNDSALLHCFHDSTATDIFIRLTSQWLGKPEPDVTSEERETTKRVVYSVIYGAGKERLSQYLKVTPEVAANTVHSFLVRFPGINKFTKTSIEQCRLKGYQVTVFGRRRWFPNIRSASVQARLQAERQAVNFCVQGSASDLCKAAMLQAEQALSQRPQLQARLLIQIHDELLYEVADGDLLAVAECVRTVMEDTDSLCGAECSLRVPLTVALSAGKVWGRMEALSLTLTPEILADAGNTG